MWSLTKEYRKKLVRVGTFINEHFHLNNNKQLFLGQGLGLNSYLNYSDDLEVYDIQPIHNIFLLILSEIGIIGVLLFINLIEKRKHNILSLGILTGFIILGLFDHYLWTSWTGLLLFSLLFYKNKV